MITVTCLLDSSSDGQEDKGNKSIFQQDDPAKSTGGKVQDPKIMIEK